MKSLNPFVSVVIPVLNEERHLAEVVAAALNQDYSGQLQVIIAAGPSVDRTNEIAQELALKDPRVLVVENPSGRTPDAMNAGITAAAGEIIVRCDGHALLPTDYVSIAVETLARTNSDNVGGIMDAQGESNFQKAVAWAMKSKFGVGSAAFHVGGTEGEAETVYLGSFKASALARVGGYDPAMTRAQDWELNHRIRETGGRVWFNPALKVTYRPRQTLGALRSQYLQYGQWRRKVMSMHPETTRRLSALRYFAPPLAVLGLIAGTVSGIAGLIFANWLLIGFVAPITYAAAVKLVAISALQNEPLKVCIHIPSVLISMHMSWGWGFLTSPAIKE